MEAETASSVIRAALSDNINTTVDELIEQVKAKGIKAKPLSVKNLTYNLRSQLRKKPAKASKPAKAVARQRPRPSPRSTAPITPSSSSAPDISSVLANVALVNSVVELAGGPENVRQVMEAVKTCGGVEAFLQHLELVAGIRNGVVR